MNAMVRDIAVGGEQLVAVTEHPMEGIGQPGLDPTRIWVGTPTAQPAGTATREPELGRTVEIVAPGEPRFFTTDPEARFLVRVTAESPVDSVEVNGEPIPIRETDVWHQITDFMAAVPLDPGLNVFDVTLYGPDIEEHTLREITFLPDAEVLVARVTAATLESITVDWVEFDPDGEFLGYIDDEPGVLEEIPLSDDVVVIAFGTAVPLRYFVDQYDGEGYGGEDPARPTEFVLTIHNGAVVQMQQVTWG
jgi:hypothetical protein